MNIFKKVYKVVGLSLAVSVAALLININGASAAVSPNGPIFNHFTNVSGIGDEHDFLRIQKDDGSRVNTVDACDGEVNMWLYVHNSQSDLYNGTNYDGVGVAHDTRVRVNIPSNESQNHTLTGYVSANNAATVSDTANITCNGESTTLDFVAGSLTHNTNLPQGYTVTGDITSQAGVLITMNGQPGGTVPGCWDYRISLNFKVKVIKKETPPPSTGVCKVVAIDVLGNRKVRASVTGQVDNAQIVGYEINWGDGKNSNKQTDEHQYAGDGTYRIVTKVQIKFADGSTEWVTSSGCTKDVTFKGEEPPIVVTPPPTVVTASKVTTLPDTGAGDVLGLFMATTAAGAAAHRVFRTRKLF